MLTLLHTNDAHNRFRERHALRLRDLKEAYDNVLLLDAGDAIGSGNIGFRPWGEAALTRMNQAGYDAMALGNREFHVWRWALQCKIKRAHFPVLCANLRRRGEPVEPPHADRPVGLETHRVLRLPNGLRVGLFGLLVEMVRPDSRAARFGHFVFTPPRQAAREMITDLRPRVDVVICLSHLGLEQDRDLARRTEGLDLILGGHSHTPLPQPERVGSTWIAQAEPYLRSVGRIHLTVREPGAVEVQGELLPLPQWPVCGGGWARW